MKEKDFNIVVCASGEGGNFQSLILHQEIFHYKILLLIVDRECYAIERAKNQGIPYVVIPKTVGWDVEFEKVIPSNVKLIVLAGFFPIIPEWICQKWSKKIINTHPSLLPKYGGKGMYGVKVQEAVILNKEKYAGCTIHYVDSGIDSGEVILQKMIDVDYSLTPYELGGKVFEEEIKLLPIAIGKIREKWKKMKKSW